MSVETDFRALLAGYAPLVALVGTRIAENAVPENVAAPLIVFTTSHTPQLGISGAVLADQVALEVTCWAGSALQADAIADAVVAALAFAPPVAGATMIARQSGFDADLGLDATVLAVEWWT